MKSHTRPRRSASQKEWSSGQSLCSATARYDLLPTSLINMTLKYLTLLKAKSIFDRIGMFRAEMIFLFVSYSFFYKI